MSGSSGSGAAYPYSSMATGCHSRIVMAPSLPRLATQAEPLSCWPPHTRYGNALSVITWYIAAVDCVYHELQLAPLSSDTTAPWSLASRMMLGSFGLIHAF